MKVTLADAAKDRVVYNITNCTKEELENKIHLFFTSRGYSSKGTIGEISTFTKGSRVLRLLFGAFVKYHKQSVVIKQEGNLYSLLIEKDSSGMSGGLIGMNQVKKEFAALTDAFREYMK